MPKLLKKVFEDSENFSTKLSKFKIILKTLKGPLSKK